MLRELGGGGKGGCGNWGVEGAVGSWRGGGVMRGRGGCGNWEWW